MTQIWTLMTENGDPIISDSDFKNIKFVQLVLAKSFILKLHPGMVTKSSSTRDHHLNDIQNKASYILAIIEAEENGIKQLHINRESFSLKRDMIVAKEFYNLVLPDDPIISKTVDLEVAELSSYKDSCDLHRGFIYKNLYSINYRDDLSKVRAQFRNGFKNPPADYHYVYEALQENMENTLKKNGLF